MRLGGIGPILYMGSTKILVGFLGVLLAFAPDLLYDFYDDRRHALGPLARSTTSTSRG